MGRKLIDLTGKTFGRWTVLERTENKGKQPCWICQCSCENKTIKVVQGSFLRNGTSKSCGCITKERLQKDLTNQRFGKLVALEKTEKRSGTQVVWKCKCDCGNICYIGAGNLVSKHTSSCGCLLKEKNHQNKFKNLTGQKFGLLTALEPTDKKDFSNIIWKCQCECGNICYVPSNRLLMKKTNSCGCIKRSAGEALIESILSKNNIPYIREKSFKDCKDSIPLPFDFYVDNKYIIEFDGEQHFKPIEHFGGEKAFLTLKKHDEIKNQWCKNNNIPLIRIPFNYLHKIRLEDLQLETTSFLVKAEDFSEVDE